MDTDPKYVNQITQDEHDNSANIKGKRVIMFAWNPTTLKYERVQSTNGILANNAPFLEVLGSATALNTDVIPSTDVSNYRSGSLQLTGTWSGAVSVQASNDNVNWVTVAMESADNGNLPVLVADTTGGNGLFKFPISYRYLRIRATSYSSGTIVGTLELYPYSQDLWPISSFGFDGNFIRGFGVEAANYLSTGGNGFDMARTPKVFTPFSATIITNETSIWTPVSGKKFRLMGYVITQGVVTGNITVKDNTAGTTILTIPAHTIGVAQISPPMGNGILSSNSNNILTMKGASTETVSGYVFGTEE